MVIKFKNIYLEALTTDSIKLSKSRFSLPADI